jgi:hypothetical protein
VANKHHRRVEDPHKSFNPRFTDKTGAVLLSEIA